LYNKIHFVLAEQSLGAISVTHTKQFSELPVFSETEVYLLPAPRALGLPTPVNVINIIAILLFTKPPVVKMLWAKNKMLKSRFGMARGPRFFMGRNKIRVMKPNYIVVLSPRVVGTNKMSRASRRGRSRTVKRFPKVA